MESRVDWQFTELLGAIEGSTLNGEPIDAPKRELPHVVGPAS